MPIQNWKLALNRFSIELSMRINALQPTSHHQAQGHRNTSGVHFRPAERKRSNREALDESKITVFPKPEPWHHRSG